ELLRSPPSTRKAHSLRASRFCAPLSKSILKSSGIDARPVLRCMTYFHGKAVTHGKTLRYGRRPRGRERGTHRGTGAGVRSRRRRLFGGSGGHKAPEAAGWARHARLGTDARGRPGG